MWCEEAPRNSQLASRWEHGGALAVVCFAAAALGSATSDGESWAAWPWLVWSGVIVATILSAGWLRRLAVRWSAGDRPDRPPGTAQHGPAISPVLVLLTISPLIWNGAGRALGFSGSTLEVDLLTGIQFLACGMAAAGVWRAYQPLAVVCSLFSVLFAASLSQSMLTMLFAGLFTAAAMVWLLGAYWSVVVARLHGSQAGKRPRWTLILPVAVLAAMAAGLGLAGNDRMLTLAGFLRSSGGSGERDDAACRGVGDGDALVAGQDDIRSFGPIEDAPFRNSPEPSLYDLYNDLFDEPVRNTKIDRAITLPSELAAKIQQRMAKSEIAHREFSTARGSRPRSPERMKSLDSDALLYVKGRVPLHLRMELFDLFDGEVWQAMEPGTPPGVANLRVEQIGKRPWLVLAQLRISDVLTKPETHAVKVIHLKGTRVPAPLHVLGLHIDRLEDASMFEWVGDGLVRMVRRELPSLTAIHVRSRVADPRKVRAETMWGRSLPAYNELPQGPEYDRIRQLAMEWTKGLPRGWRQVSAIRNRLRTEYALDPDARFSGGQLTPLGQFLFETKRGPDYQFATAAAVLLRSLGYSTRLVGGFYVSPARFDPLRQHTPVVGADAHLWTEVLMSASTWLTVEATPGYEVLGPPPTYLDRLLAGLGWAGVRLWERKGSVLLVIATVVVVVATRAAWMDQGRRLIWQWSRHDDARQRVAATLSLVDARFQRLKAARRPGETPGAALARWANRVGGSDAPFGALARLADWAAFAPAGVPAPLGSAAGRSEAEAVEEVCRAVVAAIYAADDRKPRSARPATEAVMATPR